MIYDCGHGGAILIISNANYGQRLPPRLVTKAVKSDNHCNKTFGSMAYSHNKAIAGFLVCNIYYC